MDNNDIITNESTGGTTADSQQAVEGFMYDDGKAMGDFSDASFQPVNPMNQNVQPMNPMNQNMQPMDPMNQNVQPNNMYAPQNYYGQPNVYQQGQPNVYQQGQPNGYQQMIQPPKPKMDPKKKKMIILISSIIAGLIIILGSVYALFFTPKKRLKRAMDATAERQYRLSASPYDEILGSKQIADTYLEKGGKVDFSISLNNVAENSSVTDMEMGGNVSIDKSAKKMSGGFTFGYSGESIFDAEFFGNEEKTYILLKDILDGYLSINNKDVFNQMKNAPLFRDADMDNAEMPSFDINYFQGVSIEDASGSVNQMQDDLWKESKVKSVGSETLDLGGESVKCKVYEVTVPKDKLQDYMDKLAESSIEILTNNAATSEALQQSGTNIEELKTQLKMMYRSFIVEDFIYKVYVKKGHVAAYSSKGRINLMSIRLEYDVMLKNTGKENVLSTGELIATLGVQGAGVTIYAKYGSEKNGNEIDTFIDGHISSMGSAINFKYDQKYDTGSGEISLTGGISSNAEELMNIDGSGSIDNINKGKSYTINLNDIEIKSHGRMMISFDASAGISTEPEIHEMDSSKKVIDLFTVTRDEFEAFQEENRDRIEAYKKRVEEITNKLGDD